jgi:hypothetical protein
MRFTGIIPVVFFMSLIPALVESFVTAAMSRKLFGMPENESYVMGFMLGTLGTGVSLPSIYTLYARGFKFKTALPNTIVLASTFDNIMTACIFTIFRLYTTEHIGIGDSISSPVEKVFIGIGSGIAVGVALYLIQMPLKFIKNEGWRQRILFIYFLMMAVGIPVGSQYATVPDCKWIALITVSYLVSNYS